MAREPKYPEDTPVGSTKAAGDPASQASGPAAGAPFSPAEKGSEAGRNKHLMTGAAIGIGSAAIVAALLYANRRTRNERGGNG
jgi:hypothetical protein